MYLARIFCTQHKKCTASCYIISGIPFYQTLICIGIINNLHSMYKNVIKLLGKLHVFWTCFEKQDTWMFIDRKSLFKSVWNRFCSIWMMNKKNATICRKPKSDKLIQECKIFSIAFWNICGKILVWWAPEILQSNALIIVVVFICYIPNHSEVFSN